MRTRAFFATVIGCLAVFAIPIFARQITATMSAEEYGAVLDRLRNAVEHFDPATPGSAPQPASTLPSTWRVTTPEHTYEVSADFLVRDLVAWQKAPDADRRATLLAAIDRRRTDLREAMEEPRDRSSVHADVERILSAREFAGVHGPTWFDRLRASAVALLINLLRNLFGSSSIPTLTGIVVYAIVALAGALVVALLLRTWRRDPLAVTPAGAPDWPTPRSWQQALDDAHAAALAGRWRDAVHAAYWCGIVFLETQGAWRPDPARTPREYVRLLPDGQPSRAALGALTRQMERVWYAALPAAADDFDRAIASLEQLGCRR